MDAFWLAKDSHQAGWTDDIRKDRGLHKLFHNILIGLDGHLDDHEHQRNRVQQLQHWLW